MTRLQEAQSEEAEAELVARGDGLGEVLVWSRARWMDDGVLWMVRWNRQMSWCHAVVLPYGLAVFKQGRRRSCKCDTVC